MNVATSAFSPNGSAAAAFFAATGAFATAGPPSSSRATAARPSSRPPARLLLRGGGPSRRRRRAPSPAPRPASSVSSAPSSRDLRSARIPPREARLSPPAGRRASSGGRAAPSSRSCARSAGRSSERRSASRGSTRPAATRRARLSFSEHVARRVAELVREGRRALPRGSRSATRLPGWSVSAAATRPPFRPRQRARARPPRNVCGEEGAQLRSPALGQRRVEPLERERERRRGDGREDEPAARARAPRRGRRRPRRESRRARTTSASSVSAALRPARIDGTSVPASLWLTLPRPAGITISTGSSTRHDALAPPLRRVRGERGEGRRPSRARRPRDEEEARARARRGARPPPAGRATRAGAPRRGGGGRRAPSPFRSRAARKRHRPAPSISRTKRALPVPESVFAARAGSRAGRGRRRPPRLRKGLRAHGHEAAMNPERGASRPDATKTSEAPFSRASARSGSSRRRGPEPRAGAAPRDGFDADGARRAPATAGGLRRRGRASGGPRLRDPSPGRTIIIAGDAADRREVDLDGRQARPRDVRQAVALLRERLRRDARDELVDDGAERLLADDLPAGHGPRRPARDEDLLARDEVERVPVGLEEVPDEGRDLRRHRRLLRTRRARCAPCSRGRRGPRARRRPSRRGC